MRAVDTNVLVRVLARDDTAQVASADAVVAQGGWVPLFVLQETIWVLARAYGLDRKALATTVGMLLQHTSLVLESPEIVAAALKTFRKTPGVEFSDCMILESARRAAHLPVMTFDRGFAKLDGVELLRR